ncbi:MAG: peptidyl-prolyl cis-trans isomerase [Gammaproteobacteria bacterium]|nr:peptidyl-prolyl cis-trans isomerase [Gammaproteobacteria bacterium]
MLVVSLPLKAAEQAINATHYVSIQTNVGDIVVALDADKASRTVANFLEYARSGFYRNTIFHRVIGGFMIQGGGYDTEFNRKSTRPPVLNEANNGLLNLRGTIAMARTFDPHSATSQFFINLVDNDFLNHRMETPADWGYAVFGKVVKGMDVVDAIARQQTGPGGPFPKDVPLTLVIIQDVKPTSAPAGLSQTVGQ